MNFYISIITASPANISAKNLIKCTVWNQILFSFTVGRAFILCVYKPLMEDNRLHMLSLQLIKGYQYVAIKNVYINWNKSEMLNLGEQFSGIVLFIRPFMCVKTPTCLTWISHGNVIEPEAYWSLTLHN